MDFSVIIPARNEEAFLGACLDAIDAAAALADTTPQVIVVLNRCTDRTEEIAADRAMLLREDARNLSRIRNAGAARATGDVIVTVDADSRMSPQAFLEIRRALSSGNVIGGGAPIKPDRWSLAIALTGIILTVPFWVHGLCSAGMFWCRTEDFRAIGGFDERKFTAEDYDFAKRLQAHGRRHKKRYGTLWRAPLTSSCRKFDRYGDGFVLRMLLSNPRQFARAFRGDSQEIGDRYWYVQN